MVEIMGSAMHCRYTGMEVLTQFQFIVCHCKLVPVQVSQLCRCAWRMLAQLQLAAIVNLSSPLIPIVYIVLCCI